MRVALYTRRPATVLVRVTGPAASRDVLAVVDTGSTEVLLPPGLVESIGYDLSDAPLARFVTAGGMRGMRRVVIDQIAVGEACVQGVEAVCHEIPGATWAALLGLSFLEHFRMTLSPREGLLELEEP
ncbi:MAG: aspartyl protease family protein [Armatimonadota bacterium]